MIDPEHPNGLTVDPIEKKKLAISVGICPYCMRNLSDIRTDGVSRWRYCFSCFNNFYLEPKEET